MLRTLNFNLKKDWLTTVTGVVLAIITILNVTGVLTPDQSASIQSNSAIIMDAVSKIIGAVSAIILMFTGSKS
jgi:hypothetical protein